jgi:fructoselysine-6-P-deglycase FrlB-like protein
MSHTMQRIGYRDAVARQPDCLSTGIKAVRETLKAFDPIPFASRSIGFAGIGASFQAAMIGATYARSLGLRSYAYCPTDLYDERADGAEAFVALSASGQSREIADVMRMRRQLPRIAICRGSDNPLAAITGAVVATESGSDNGASSTGYTGMLMAIGMLVERIALGTPSAAWDGLPQAVADVLTSAAIEAEQAAILISKRTTIDIVGSGAGFATAGEAAMLIREAVRVPAAGWDTLNYLHGPMESQDSTTGLMAFGEGREVQIACDVAAFGCPSVLITCRPDVPTVSNLVTIKMPSVDHVVIDAILKIVIAQMIVGDMQDAAGLTNTTFRYRQTDTKLKPWSPTEV